MGKGPRTRGPSSSSNRSTTKPPRGRGKKVSTTKSAGRRRTLPTTAPKPTRGALDYVPDADELVEEDVLPEFDSVEYVEGRRLQRAFIGDPLYAELANRLEQQAIQKFESLALPSPRVWNRQSPGPPPSVPIEVGAHEVHHFIELMQRARDYAVLKPAQSEFADRFYSAWRAYTDAVKGGARREVGEGLAFKAFFDVDWRTHTSRHYNPRLIRWQFNQLRAPGPVPWGFESLTWVQIRTKIPDAPKRVPTGAIQTDTIRTPLTVGWAHAAIAVVWRFDSADAARKYLASHTD